MVLLAACTAEAPPPPPPLARSDVNPNAFVGTPQEVAAKAQEAAILKAHPEMAIRNGPELVISYRGEPLVTYTDNPQGCDRYIVERAIEIRDPDSGTLEPIALVACHFGTTTNRYLVLPNSGKYNVMGDIAASPNGRYLATTDSTVTKARGAFIITQWPNTESRAEFPAGCKNIEWQSDSALTADCWRSEHPNTVNPDESDAVFFRAKVWRDDETWRMTATDWLARDGSPALSNRPYPLLAAIDKTGVDAPE
ncbi:MULTISPECIES: hypothetical protein [Asticcacaulis]|uniref:hypothetical protein n=1 Tax=Asticcacaulis TaxID=76890 RepID=UPI001AE57D62|nr:MULTISPECIES: hypothetical protein [Asticcacaulis]MBP2158211.1 hypothetical protein [Asticcacaulis solisilvae]MDR6799256.1 hypothetical protein [Asticcacaulis sp. BE141]